MTEAEREPTILAVESFMSILLLNAILAVEIYARRVRQAIGALAIRLLAAWNQWQPLLLRLTARLCRPLRC